jgi:hypothetical protein
LTALNSDFAGNPDLRQRALEMDQIDLQGWLTRILLPEFKRLGDRLWPRHFWSEDIDGVYITARDTSIPAANAVFTELRNHMYGEAAARNVGPLRPDFASRVGLRRRQRFVGSFYLRRRRERGDRDRLMFARLSGPARVRPAGGH